MINKSGLLILVLMTLVQGVYSQSLQEDTNFSRALGIDATFINNFLPLDNSIGGRGTYLLHYIKYKNNNKITRHALDVDLFGEFANFESQIVSRLDNSRVDIDYKISIGKQKQVLKNKGYILYGSEIAAGYFFNRRFVLDPNDPQEESFNTNIDQNIFVGYGPFVGFGYKIFKRISLYTETGVALRLSYGLDKFKSDFSPTTDFNDTNIAISAAYVLPRSIILFYHF